MLLQRFRKLNGTKMDLAAVSIKDLSFCYSRQASACLTNINLEIKQGERFGLFGPNGAGKTTLILLMTGLMRPTSGVVKILGQDISGTNNIKQSIGFIPQDFAFYPELSPVENLEYLGALSGLNKLQIKAHTDELLTTLGLNEVRKNLIKTFSGGMKRRMNIAIGVINQPEILFLDEPTMGVDVQSRLAIINYLKILNTNGVTLVYTSHHLKEAEDLCEQVALIDEGKIIVNDGLNSLKAHHKEQELEGLFLKLTGKDFRD